MCGSRGARCALSNRPAPLAVSERQLPSRHLFRAVITPDWIQDGSSVSGLLCSPLYNNWTYSPSFSCCARVHAGLGRATGAECLSQPDSVCWVFLVPVEVFAVLRTPFSAFWTRRWRQVWHVERKFVGQKGSLTEWTGRSALSDDRASEGGEPVPCEAQVQLCGAPLASFHCMQVLCSPHTSCKHSHV